MKKITSALIAIIMLCTFNGCAEKEQPTDAAKPDNTVASVDTEKTEQPTSPTYETYPSTKYESIPENKVHITFDSRKRCKIVNAAGEVVFSGNNEEISGNMNVYKYVYESYFSGKSRCHIWVDPSDSFTFINTGETCYEDLSVDETDQNNYLKFTVYKEVTVTNDEIIFRGKDVMQTKEKPFADKTEYRGRKIVIEQ